MVTNTGFIDHVSKCARCAVDTDPKKFTEVQGKRQARARAIAKLDLDPIKIKLLAPDNHLQWDRERVDAVEQRYRQFLQLVAKYPDCQVIPTKEIDEFWHVHILDTRKYAMDCENVFGRFLHHFPYFGMRGGEDAQNLITAFRETQDLWRSEFGEALIKGLGAADCKVADCDGEQCMPNFSSRDRRRPSLAR